MLNSSSQLPAPGRLFLPGCAIAAGLLAVSSPVFAAPIGKAHPKALPAKAVLVNLDGPMTLRVGKTFSQPLPRPMTFAVEEGFQNVYCEESEGTLTIKALGEGNVKIRLNTPGKPVQFINLKLVQPKLSTVETRSMSEVVERPTDGNAVPTDTPTVTGAVGSTPVVASPTSPEAPAANTPTATLPQTVDVAPATAPSALSTDLSGEVTPPTPPAPTLPALTPPTLSTSPTPTAAKPVMAPPAITPQISPVMHAPSRSVRANVGYTTSAHMPKGVSAAGRPAIDVKQGLARLLSFPSNILAVFFSDPSVMDARAINARTIAVTGIGPGDSTLAVFTAQSPTDAIGRANIYRIKTSSRGDQSLVETRDPKEVENAISNAIGDPRIHVSVITVPGDALVARLSGTVRNDSEVQAAVTTASFFARVVSSLYADSNAPTLDAVMASNYNQAPESDLQEKLRRISGNQTIELVPLPTGLGFKAEVDSSDEADQLLRLLPTLNQQVIPFIVVHGQPGYSNPTIPLLNGEDRQLTQKLNDVTGIRTVYAVRTASNAIACYGTVRNRSDYDTVRRYMTVMAQTSTPPAVQGTSQGGETKRPTGSEGAPLPNYDPTGGYVRSLGLQMFVRITDPGQSVIRKVTVETSVVEINRTAMKQLGVTYGSSSLTDETRTAGTTTPVLDGAGNPVIGANGNPFVVTTPGTLTRTINPGLNQGVLLGGNGFLGTGGFSNIDPFRAQLNALATSGDARVLSRPNVTAVEGATAQITIGGERPVPKVVATQGAVGTEVEFRRFGVIISMRPTVTGDNTILLQIRADITQPDRTYEINVAGAIVPGESVRSVDTTLNVRAGDTIVMGGLMTNEKRMQTSKVPILGDLPIIGSLFKSKQFDNNQTELAIFMTPHIDSMPVDSGTLETMLAAPGFPVLPSRQESNGILFQETKGN